MKTALAIAVCGVCAAASGQQARVQYTWEWSEVFAGTAIPSPATPGVIDPTEGVRLTLNALMVPGVGQAVTYVPPPLGPGTGVVHSWGGNETVVQGSAGSEGLFELMSVAAGFSQIMLAPLGATSVRVGVEALWGSGQPLNTSNPVQGLLSFTWTPQSYSPRTVSFGSVSPASSGFVDVMIVRYGTGPTGAPLLTGTAAIANHGPGTGGIPIVPGPGGMSVLLAGAAVLAGPRRRGRASA